MKRYIRANVTDFDDEILHSLEDLMNPYLEILDDYAVNYGFEYEIHRKLHDYHNKRLVGDDKISVYFAIESYKGIDSNKFSGLTGLGSVVLYFYLSENNEYESASLSVYGPCNYHNKYPVADGSNYEKGQLLYRIESLNLDYSKLEADLKIRIEELETRYIELTGKSKGRDVNRGPSLDIVKDAIYEYVFPRMNSILENEGWGEHDFKITNLKINTKFKDKDTIYYVYRFEDEKGVSSTGYYSFVKGYNNEWEPVSEVYDDNDELRTTVDDYLDKAGL